MRVKRQPSIFAFIAREWSCALRNPIFLVAAFLVVSATLHCDRVVAQETIETARQYKTTKDVLYREIDSLPAGERTYARQRCRLDVYAPTNVDGFSTVVWFHGGGLTSGNRSVPAGLKDSGIAVV
ncbi:MAG: hypothetical protein AAFP90_18095, partial [Planctomycetota bacterium]